MNTIIVSTLALTLLAVPIEQPAGNGSKAPVSMEVSTDMAVATPGEPFKVEVTFVIADGWHIYAPWPGNTGESTIVEFETDTEVARVSDTRFQHPETWDRDRLDLTSFGYSGRTRVQAVAMVSEQPKDDAFTLTVKASWLACREKCIGQSETKSLRIPVGPAGIMAPSGVGRTPYPDPLEASEAWLSSVKYSDGVWDLSYRLAGFDSIEDFVPIWTGGGDCLVDSWNTSPVPEKGGFFNLSLRLRGTDCLPFAGGFAKGLKTGSAATGQYRFKAFSDPSNSPWKAAPAETPPTGPENATVQRTTEISNAAGESSASFSWYFLLLAFADGLLLNVMPCVIPVIVPKLNHLVRTAVSYTDRRERHRMLLLNGLAYSAGIFVTMIGFALVIVGLKTAGHQVGWGFQFQNPTFLAIMIGVLMLMSLGMLGVFPMQGVSHTEDLRELRAMRRRSLIIESFLTGLLVTFLGTPCTAPMLGPAVGFAFLAGNAQIFAFFGVLATGFALPFLLLAIFPGWTEHLKNFRVSEKGNRWSHGLAFFLLATMVWLIGVLGSGYGVDAIGQILWFLLLIGLLSWFYGVRCVNAEEPAAQKLEAAERQIASDLAMDPKERVARKDELRKAFYRNVRRQRIVTAGLLLAVLSAGGAMILRFDESGDTGLAVTNDGPVKWRKWSREAVDTERAEGRPVFVDVTASWCMNCKTNEKLILDRPDAAKLFEEHGMVPFVADFSRRDPTIASLLKQYKRVGVPVYLVYPPCEGEPAILPEILTPEILAEAVRAAGHARGCR